MTRPAWQEVVSQLGGACEAAGFDLIHPFNLAGCDFPALCRGLSSELTRRPGGLGILVGNTRRLWPRFVQACHEDATLARAEHPLNTYVTRQLTRGAAGCAAPTQLIFAHVTQPAAFPIQRLAQQVGLAALAPCHLALHPTHGLWFALRAVLVVDVDGPPAAPPAQASSCIGCSAPCVPALEHAIAVSGSPLGARAVAEHARAWIAVRDACPIGRASRYGEAQLDYHYAPAASKLTQGS